MTDYVKLTVITPDGEERDYWSQPGKTVWEVMETIGWDTGGSCGGMGTCSKCKFRMSGQVRAISADERERLMPEEIRKDLRLACMAVMEGDMALYIDFWPDACDAKTALFGYQADVGGQLPVFNHAFIIPGLDKDRPVPIYDRVKQTLGSYQMDLDPENLNYLAGLDRQGRPVVELYGLVMDNQRVIKVSRARTAVHGLAIDIGTTSLFTALLNLEEGRVLAIAAHSNMQRIYGDDIIARVNHVRENIHGLATMQRILVNNLNSMITEMAATAGVDPEQIYIATAVGNPVMLHFLAGINTSGFEGAPYAGVFAGRLDLAASELGLSVNPGCQLTFLPQLGGFVGADTTAGLLTLHPYHEKTFLLLDIGTNGEIVLCHLGHMWTASAAAGPAFEGGAITCGMRAGMGAIDKVAWIDDQLQKRVIGGGMPRGLCGSGIIDLISLLLTNGFIDHQGTFTAKVDAAFDTRDGQRGHEIILAGEDEMSGNSLLVFNQEDVRQFQLARSAMRTAVEIMLKEAGIVADHLEHIFLAGAFGTYVDPVSIINTGIIPRVEADKIKNLGNAAADGAVMALIQPGMIAEAEAIQTKVKYIELALREEFQALFIKNLDF